MRFRNDVARMRATDRMADARHQTTTLITIYGLTTYMHARARSHATLLHSLVYASMHGIV
jgi:hypothetical protein